MLTYVSKISKNAQRDSNGTASFTLAGLFLFFCHITMALIVDEYSSGEQTFEPLKKHGPCA